MVANLTLAAFLGGLVVSLVFGFPLVCALLFGLVLFIAYARYLKVSVRKIALLLAVGVKKLKNILIIFTLIGFLTALWRACGTYSLYRILRDEAHQPSIFSGIRIFPVLFCFLPLWGTAFWYSLAQWA